MRQCRGSTPHGDCSGFASSSAGSDSQAVSQSRNPTTPPVALVRDEEGFCISLISLQLLCIGVFHTVQTACDQRPKLRPQQS